MDKKLFFTNSYVIANGTLCAVDNNYTWKELNDRLRIIYKDEMEFAEAKEKNKITLDGYNACWDLTGIIPKFK